MYNPRIIVDLEVTNNCNAHCFMCPREKIKAAGFMSSETFRKVISRIEEYGRIELISFCGNGEPLLHPQIIDFIKCVKDKKFKAGLSTNGSLLTKERAKGLISSGIDLINISFSSNDQQTYNKIHCGLDFEQVKRNIEDAISLAKGKKALIDLVIIPTEFNQSEINSFIDYWYRKGIDYCFVFGTHNKGGNLSKQEGIASFQPHIYYPDAIEEAELFKPSRKDYLYFKKKAEFPCPVKQRFLFIDYSGNYDLCCMDISKDYLLGNVEKNSISQINQIKNKMLLKDYKICQECSYIGLAKSLGYRSPLFYWQFAKIKLKNLFRRAFKNG